VFEKIIINKVVSDGIHSIIHVILCTQWDGWYQILNHTEHFFSIMKLVIQATDVKNVKNNIVSDKVTSSLS
jgi:hypothetical protein